MCTSFLVSISVSWPGIGEILAKRTKIPTPLVASRRDNCELVKDLAKVVGQGAYLCLGTHDWERWLNETNENRSVLLVFVLRRHVDLRI